MGGEEVYSYLTQCYFRLREYNENNGNSNQAPRLTFRSHYPLNLRTSKLTERGIPKRSPIYVLTSLEVAVKRKKVPLKGES